LGAARCRSNASTRNIWFILAVLIEPHRLAGNRPEILDPALLRAGVSCVRPFSGRPDKKGRVELLRVHFKRVELARM
jgi:SpoVK/Ycf46/Vps4 family AAA+-type ATPase